MAFPIKKEVDGVMLTAKEELFINHPDALVNPRKAAIESGYSPQYADKRAYEVRAKFRDLIIQKTRDRLDAEGATDGRLLKELGALALYNVVDAYHTIEIDGDGGETVEVTVLKDLKKLPEDLQRAIKKVEMGQMIAKNGRIVSYVEKIEFHDKLGALRDYLKVRGIYEPDRRKPKEAEDVNPLDELSIEELEEISQIHERAQKRLAQKASAMRDSQAIEGEVIQENES
jgi:hypothetical protein